MLYNIRILTYSKLTQKQVHYQIERTSGKFPNFRQFLFVHLRARDKFWQVLIRDLITYETTFIRAPPNKTYLFEPLTVYRCFL